MTAIDTEGVLELVREVGAGLCATFWRSTPAVSMDDVRAAEAALRRQLAEDYPAIAWADGLLSEADARSGEYWICDAVDGVEQFLRAIPNWCMSLTLMREGVPVLAVIYDAMHDEMFHALWRHGAWYNGSPVRVGARQDTPLVATRSLGPAALQLAYVACGRLDGFWQHGNDGCRCIGGALLVREAGGMATQADGQPYHLTARGIAVAAPVLHASVLRRLQDRLAA
ncbi:inositol-phosphate phosphatase [Pseudoduganella sp. FT25W]|jgi:myo-inositol-1(or 4)-monophosphatase|uniref:Inositol-phosphate phosphatase n=1 Tax=Duganella alba TaxID=2666081 RepID=A0A6L5QIT7_9BURK|nr:inositol monophosphatase family protein [Duganella alba]MRX08891.1 inositol-phosphate phosphatase [Duganella alba]MRX18815.1 inositol-phosphate phosphatase [Duganella alba]